MFKADDVVYFKETEQEFADMFFDGKLGPWVVTSEPDGVDIVEIENGMCSSISRLTLVSRRKQYPGEVKVKRLRADAKLPVYGTAGAACFDISTTDAKPVRALCTETYSTGLAFEVPEDHVMLVFSRSGHGFNDDIRLANCVGVIDSDYRGELKVKLTSDATSSKTFAVGDRIAQAMVLPVSQVSFVEVQELSSTERGEGGFGSTGEK